MGQGGRQIRMRSLTGSGVLRSLAGGSALLVLTAFLFGAAWISTYVTVGLVGGPADTAAWGATLGLLAVGGWMTASAGASLTLRVLAYQLGLMFFLGVFLTLLWISIGVLTMTMTGSTTLGVWVGLGAAGVVGLGAIGLFVTGLWGAEDVDDWRLFVRIGAASLALSVLTLFLFWVTWLLAFIAATFVFIAFPLQEPALELVSILATGLTVSVIAFLIRSRTGVVNTIERRADAEVISPEEAPHLHAVVNRMAAQLDIPAPTLAVSTTDVPEAMIVGVRPSNMHLVLSTGAIETLSDDELTAVIAHELAHVANRDAVVMTALSTPSIIADGLRPDLGTGDSESLTAGAIIGIGVKLFVYVVMSVPWAMGTVIVASLGREREAAADRVAAETLGTPTPLIGALTELDTSIQSQPEEDLRGVSDVSTLSIVPLDPAITNEINSPSDRIKHRLFGTHPTTPDRIAQLQDYGPDQ